MANYSTLAAFDAQVPRPPSERWQWLLAIALGVIGLAVVVAVLTGAVGRTTRTVLPAGPPVVLEVAATPVPGPAASASVLAGATGSMATPVGSRARRSRGAYDRIRPRHAPRSAVVARASSARLGADSTRLVDRTETSISPHWMEGFYRIYGVAQSAFGVNWLLLASIHKQESAFSTDPTTYEGLNFAGCCGGPMQFNVTNGPATTWDIVSDSYRYGKRPVVYDHMTATHPSIYDDFDAIMGAARLLSSDGAAYALNGSAWDAAYDYYGHDTTGVSYADQVLARAIGWSQHGFCIDCGVESAMVEAVQAAYGAPVSTLLKAPGSASR
jgi:hypothetical protein